MEWNEYSNAIVTLASGTAIIAFARSFINTLQEKFDKKFDKNDQILVDIRNDIRSESIRLSEEIAEVRKEMHQESKDFHGRLCALEEKYHQLDRKENNATTRA